MAITESITISRSSGAAHLYVHFSAVGTTSTATSRPWDELEYEWDFGDSGAGTWSLNGLPKNKAFGPIAAHVYETPGTYSPTVTIREPWGGVTKVIELADVTVDDPDTVFAGADTVCISNTTDHTGAPVGATLIDSTSTLSGIDAQIAAGRRVLLHAGHTFAGSTTITLDTDSGLLGRYGTGADPILEFSNAGTGSLFTIGIGGNDWRIQQLEVHATAVPVAGARILVGTGGSHPDRILVSRCSSDHSWSQGWFVNDTSAGGREREQNENCVYETIVNLDHLTTGAENALRGGGHKLAVLGCTLDTGGQHNIRYGFWRECVISHNDLASTDSPDEHNMKLHAKDFDDDTAVSRYIVISHNHVTGIAQFMVALTEESSSDDQRQEYAIVEKNFFIPTGQTVLSAVQIMTRYSAVRNNVVTIDRKAVNNTSGNDWFEVSRHTGGIGPVPLDVYVYNNTVFDDRVNDEDVTAVRFSQGSGHIARNNLLYTPSTGTIQVVDDLAGGNTASNNVNASAQAESDVFDGGVPATPVATDFYLANSSYAQTNLHNSGFDVPGWFHDYELDYKFDDPPIGAFEFGAGSPPGPGEDVAQRKVMVLV